jgi:hypothetical protein
MDKFADLEIGLRRSLSGGYSVDFRFNRPDSDAEDRLGSGEIALNTRKLEEQVFDPADYSQELTRSFFADPSIKTAFLLALKTARDTEVPLRVRLFIDTSASDLHSLRWENLNDPRDHTPLWTSENLYFSRFLTSYDWRRVGPRPRHELQTLVMVANPKDLKEMSSLDPIDVEGELTRARDSLKDIPVTVLPDPNSDERASLDNLIIRLRKTPYDILYLVCHGALRKAEGTSENGELKEPWLWLEDEQGNTARTSGKELATRLKELDQPPVMVVLASCQSAGTGEGDALAALGPQLAEAGIPAVLAMQGNITMETVAKFMPVFFEELQKDGQIDRAISIARGMVRNRPDYWMPALFTRLKSGRIWYTPGFGEIFDQWPTLVDSIYQGQCTPILGPGLFEPILGSLKDFARLWSEEFCYPMESYWRESLPQVAQYLAITQSPVFPHNKLQESLTSYIRNRHRTYLPENLLQGRVSPDVLLNTVGAIRREKEPRDGYKLLAELPFSIYITTNLNSLLTSAIKEVKINGMNRSPVVKICPWNDEIEQDEDLYKLEDGYEPSPERPLVYHLFGRLGEPDSVVLTEDNYFDFLIGVTRNMSQIPSVVQKALSKSALLFLGFQLEEWIYRVLLRFILSLPGSYTLGKFPHIAAQIEPEEGRILEPKRAKKYLQDYLVKGAKNARISIYWGSTEDFLDELVRQYKAST